MQTFTSHSPQQTQEYAKNLAASLQAPQLILLEGNLGLGKTTFVSGFIKGLNGGDNLRIQSPTYALARTYQTTPILHHIDLYRLQDSEAAYELGLEDILEDPQTITLIEWPSKLPSLYLRPHILITFEEIHNSEERIIHVDIK